MSGYVIGVDIGGTFTDSVVIGADGQVTIGKAPSTPPSFHEGFVGSLAASARRLGKNTADLAAEADAILHGCTVGTNALVERRTPKVALLTTAGHEDTLFFMRAGHRMAEMNAGDIAHLAGHVKPEPLVPKALVRGVDERVAADGSVLVKLDEDGARSRIRDLLDEGVEAFAIALLWSTANDAHERTLAEIVRQESAPAFCSLSADVVPRPGEYERTVATVINAMIGRVTGSYLGRVEDELSGLGFCGELSIMSCAGGLIDVGTARRLPLLTIGSGPVAGVIGAGRMVPANESGRGVADILTADMGGTTFDVGVIRKGRPVARPTTRFGQYEYFVPTLDVRSVGAGGGSIAWYDDESVSLRVGPRSAGAVPGPAAYLRGGTHATVTDADLVLGHLNPEYFLRGELELGVQAAHDALARAGAPLGLSAEQTASAVARIVDNQMADAILLASVHQGYDPRDSVMYSYGGAGGVHCPGVAKQLGIRELVMPMGDLAAGWSAFGVTSADALIVREMPLLMQSPFDPDRLTQAWDELESTVLAALPDSMPASEVTLARTVEMRYTMQVNELSIDAPSGHYGPEHVAGLVDTFNREYEGLYGPGSAYTAAGLVITSLRVSARRGGAAPTLAEMRTSDALVVRPIGSREVIWYELGTGRVVTPVYRGTDLGTGSSVRGPAIVEFVNTTLALREGQRAEVDSWSNLVIETQP